jgi:EAL domain-containing protein (putative c-di-GMP-specific phosphodiesterase class I)
VHLRRAQNNERFVAFAFAGADMLAETDLDGVMTYAAGAFRSKFGSTPESYVGKPLRELVAASDHDTIDLALALLRERGRLPPMMIRLSDAERSLFSLAGIALAAQGRPPRLCLSFARPPVPLTSARHGGSAHGLARAAEARLRAGERCGLGLIEILGRGSDAISGGEALGQALQSAVPDALVTEIAPGRFGLLGEAGTQSDLQAIAAAIGETLRSQGVEVTVAARHLKLADDRLTQTQAARGLRQALNSFARDGAAGFDEAGLGAGLAGYMRRAESQTANLRRAIRGGHFSLLYQPIVSLLDGSLHYSEALIRPEGLPDTPHAVPQDFVMLVEALALADELDLAVARLACEAAARTASPVAFNLSGQSVQSAGFRQRLVELLSTSTARTAGLISIEMTEAAELEDMAEASRTADALRVLGVPFCLDDFGAGAADIRLLRELKADIVKLDGSYVPGVAQGGRERTFVAGMVEIARGAGAEIIAERLETEAEADVLRKLGVQYGQGWLFGRPGTLPVRPATRRV